MILETVSQYESLQWSAGVEPMTGPFLEPSVRRGMFPEIFILTSLRTFLHIAFFYPDILIQSCLSPLLFSFNYSRITCH
jgi:hypothetical protein